MVLIPTLLLVRLKHRLKIILRLKYSHISWVLIQLFLFFFIRYVIYLERSFHARYVHIFTYLFWFKCSSKELVLLYPFVFLFKWLFWNIFFRLVFINIDSLLLFMFNLLLMKRWLKKLHHPYLMSFHFRYVDFFLLLKFSLFNIFLILFLKFHLFLLLPLKLLKVLLYCILCFVSLLPKHCRL